MNGSQVIIDHVSKRFDNNFVALCSVALARCGVIADGNILLVSLAFSLAALVFVRGRKFNNAAVRGKTIAKTAAQEREVEK